MVADRATDKFMGTVVLDRRSPTLPGHVRAEGRELELSYQLLPAFWGKGYAFEATRALLSTTALHHDTDEPVLVLTQSSNMPSTALMTRLGFVEHEQFELWDAMQTLAVAPLRAFPRTSSRWRQNPVTHLLEPDSAAPALRPTRPVVRPERIAQRALAAIGYNMVNPETGKATGEGIHTLRRSGGRALFDSLQAMEPYRDEDGEVIRAPSYPIRQVQAMLHHANQQTTERYIGLEPDRYERDKLLRGRWMYPQLRNVIDLKEKRKEGEVPHAAYHLGEMHG